MNTTIAKLLFYTVRYLRGEFVHKYIKESKNIENLPWQDIQKIQLHKLKSILQEYQSIPYIKKCLIEKNISINDIATVDDIILLPVIDKKIYKKNLDNLKNAQISKHTQRSTSGSTGQPFVFCRDRFSLAVMDAVMYSVYGWHNIKMGERQARFWGLPFDSQQRRIARIKDLLMNRIRLSAFNLNETSFRNYYYQLYKFCPGYIYGYPSLVYEFALFCNKNKLPLHKLKLKAIIVTGEKLLQEQETYIERIFKTKLVQEYGCSEVGIIAFQCGAGKMHIMSPNIIFEVIKDNKSVVDESGDIVITELNVKSYPFLRYKIGDTGILHSEKCTCGLSWPIISINKGRQGDYIITPSGGKIYSAVLAYTFNKFLHEITKFKAYQRKGGNLDIMVEVTSAYDENVERQCKEQIASVIGDDLEIQIKVIEKISRGQSGKLRYFVSEYNGK